MGQLAKTYKRSNIPLYLQVSSTLRRRIESGYWKKGEQISTIEELEREFEVARVTVRQAIDLLQDEGLVRRQQGKGTFVKKHIKENRWLRLEIGMSSLLETIAQNVPHFLNINHVSEPPLLHEGSGDLADAYVNHRSVQSKNKEPYGLVDVHLAKHIFDMAPDEFESNIALPMLSRLEGISISRAHQTLVISTADTETSHLLKTPLNAPVAEANCIVTDDQNVAIYVADIIYRGDCIKFDIELLQTLNAENNAG